MRLRLIATALVLIIGLSSAPAALPAVNAVPAQQGHCYVSGAIDISGQAGGTDWLNVEGYARAGNETPAGYDITYYHPSCNAVAVRVRVWSPAGTDSVECYEGWQEPGGTCFQDSEVEVEPETKADLGAYSAANYYNIATAYGQVWYWSDPNEFGIPQNAHESMSLQDSIDLGDPPHDPVEGGDAGDCFNPDHDCPMDPIVIPTGKGNRYELTDAENGVMFDGNGDGVKERVGWTAAGAPLAFLALDRNENGTIDSGAELLGNATIEGAANGFIALTKLVGRKQAAVTKADPLFAKLLLWTDSNHDGVSQPNELAPFSSLYSEISLGYTGFSRRDGHGNLFKYRGSVVEKYDEEPKHLSLDKRMGKTRYIYDVIFVGQ